ncbi:MAG TPA: ribosome biogenesis GTPase Der, partial [Flavobacteriaceae bacterium]|nr:ribosome biogenesis GTPase Der [Flavobacteriaceae bacterium]
LVDTAGMRKKGKVSEDLEFYSVMRSVRAIEECDVCVLVIDAERGIEAQDLNILYLAERNRKGVVILINKWDLLEKETNTMKEYKDAILKRIAPFTDVPVLFISALTKQRVLKAVDTFIEVYENRSRRIKTSKLNETLLPIIEITPPPAVKGKYIKIKYVTQLPTK